MASDTGCKEDAATVMQSQEGVLMSKPNLQDVEHRLVTMSEKIDMCNKILNDLKDLNDVLVRKCLLDLSLPPQE